MIAASTGWFVALLYIYSVVVVIGCVAAVTVTLLRKVKR